MHKILSITCDLQKYIGKIAEFTYPASKPDPYWGTIDCYPERKINVKIEGFNLRNYGVDIVGTDIDGKNLDYYNIKYLSSIFNEDGTAVNDVLEFKW